MNQETKRTVHLESRIAAHAGEFARENSGTHQIPRSACIVTALLAAVVMSATGTAASSEVASVHHASGVNPATSCDGQWHTLPAVDPANQYGDLDSLNAVAALSLTDIWAVGQFHQFAGNSYDQTLAEHWDGANWTLVPTPTPAKKISVLNGVAAIASNDMWAVGYTQDTGFSAPYLALIEHWDGNAWSIVQNGTFPGYLTSVAAVSPNDVWAVGSTYYIGHGLIEHWDGNAWTALRLPGPEFLRSVLAISQNDVWAVGQLSHDVDGDYSFAVHFDGSNWTRVPTPNPLAKHNIDQNWITSLTALSSSDVWATLVSRDTDYGILDHTFALHWDASRWQLVRTQNPGGKSKYNDFWGIAALAPDDVWTVGSSGEITFRPLTERWDGAAWRLVTTPSVEGALLGLARVPSQSALVATGNQIVQNSYTGTLVEYVCGGVD